MDKIYSIQAARGIAAWMVVAFHMRAIEAKYLSVNLLPEFFDFGYLGVDVFFVISGFVMVHTTNNAPRGIGSSLHFFLRRASRIYPPYWFYSLLLLPVLVFAPDMINSSQGGEVNIIRSFFLLPDDKLPLLLVGWSLVFEMWFYLVFAFVMLMPPRFLPGLLVVWFLVIVTTAGGEFSTPAANLVTSPYGLEFISGCFAALIGGRLRKRSAQVMLMVGVITTGTVLLVVPSTVASSSVERCILIGVCVAMILASLATLERVGDITVTQWLKSAGDSSYSLYLSHVLLLSALGRLWFGFFGEHDYGVVGVIFFWGATAISVAIWAHVSFILIEKPATRFLQGAVRKIMPAAGK